MTIQGALPQKITLSATITATIPITYGRAVDFQGGLSLVTTRPLGIAQSTVVFGEAVTIGMDGIVEVELAGGCVAGDPLTPSITGTMQVAAAGQYVLLRAISPGSAGGKTLAVFSREGNLN